MDCRAPPVLLRAVGGGRGRTRASGTPRWMRLKSRFRCGGIVKWIHVYLLDGEGYATYLATMARCCCAFCRGGGRATPARQRKTEEGSTPPGPGEGLVVRVNAVSVSPNATFSVTGFCPSGWFATGGGYQTNGMQVHTSKYSDSALGSGWTVTGLNLTPFSTGTVRVTVQCTPATNISAIDSAPGVVPPSP